MEPESSLPHSQVLDTCPYLEWDQFSPCHHIHFLKIHLNIVHPFSPGFSKWSLSLRFSHQSPVYASVLPHTRYMSRPPHSSRFVTRTTLGENYVYYRLLSSAWCKFLHYSVSLTLLGPNIFLSTLFSNPLGPTFLPQFERPSFTLIHNNRQNYISVYLNLYILDNKLEDKRFCTEWKQSLSLQTTLNFFLNRFLIC